MDVFVEEFNMTLEDCGKFQAGVAALNANVTTARRVSVSLAFGDDGGDGDGSSSESDGDSDDEPTVPAWARVWNRNGSARGAGRRWGLGVYGVAARDVDGVEAEGGFNGTAATAEAAAVGAGNSSLLSVTGAAQGSDPGAADNDDTRAPNADAPSADAASAQGPAGSADAPNTPASRISGSGSGVAPPLTCAMARDRRAAALFARARFWDAAKRRGVLSREAFARLADDAAREAGVVPRPSAQDLAAASIFVDWSKENAVRGRHSVAGFKFFCCMRAALALTRCVKHATSASVLCPLRHGADRCVRLLVLLRDASGRPRGLLRLGPIGAGRL